MSQCETYMGATRCERDAIPPTSVCDVHLRHPEEQPSEEPSGQVTYEGFPIRAQFLAEQPEPPQGAKWAMYLLEEMYANWGTGGQQLVTWFDAHSAEVEQCITDLSRGEPPQEEGPRCDACGEPHWYNFYVPDDVWERISLGFDIPGGGTLCVRCIDKRCTDLGIKTTGRFHFTGESVTAHEPPQRELGYVVVETWTHPDGTVAKSVGRTICEVKWMASKPNDYTDQRGRRYTYTVEPVGGGTRQDPAWEAAVREIANLVQDVSYSSDAVLWKVTGIIGPLLGVDTRAQSARPVGEPDEDWDDIPDALEMIRPQGSISSNRVAAFERVRDFCRQHSPYRPTGLPSREQIEYRCIACGFNSTDLSDAIEHELFEFLACVIGEDDLSHAPAMEMTAPGFRDSIRALMPVGDGNRNSPGEPWFYGPGKTPVAGDGETDDE